MGFKPTSKNRPIQGVQDKILSFFQQLVMPRPRFVQRQMGESQLVVGMQLCLMWIW